MNDDNKFDYGESVKIKDTAPSCFRPGQIASVCGMIKIQTQMLAEKYTSNIGEWIYTVEYIGGSDTEIPECYLDKFEDKNYGKQKNKFDYGEQIMVSLSAPEKYHPNEVGFICGMIDIDSYESAIAYDCIGSDWLYTVEFLSGSSIQIPEKHLQKDIDE